MVFECQRDDGMVVVFEVEVVLREASESISLSSSAQILSGIAMWVKEDNHDVGIGHHFGRISIAICTMYKPKARKMMPWDQIQVYPDHDTM